MFSTTFTASMPSLPRLRRARLHEAVAIALLFEGFAVLPATAATIAVTSPDDTDPAAAGTCTLRQAILSMNSATLKGNCANTGGAFGSDDAITFAASSITGAATPGTIALRDSADASGTVGGTLVISDDDLTIDGSAWRGSGAGQYADGVTIARPDGANNAFGIVHGTAASGGLLVLDGLAIRNGKTSTGGGVNMDAADLSMTDSRVSSSSANYGGGISSQSGDITLTRCTIDGNTGNGVYSPSGTVTVTASTISGNGVWNVSPGGGINAGGTLVVVDSTISGNSGTHGAGIDSGGQLSLTGSVVAGNDAYMYGGGIHVRAGSTATLTGSTINGNNARYSGGGAYSHGALTVTDSTITGNTCFHDGGGIVLSGGGTLHLDHATLARNHAGGAGGGVGNTGIPWTGSATIDHSIISENEQASGTDVDLGSAWSGVGNLISSPDTNLGPLQDNGGPTPTMLPGPGSAALDAIAPQDCTQSIDQRGIARPQGPGCDIGATEVVPDDIFTDGFDG